MCIYKVVVSSNSIGAVQVVDNKGPGICCHRTPGGGKLDMTDG